MVRQWQEMFYNARYSETPILSPDYVKLAGAYGLEAYKVEELKDVIPTMRKAQKQQGPSLIEFIVEKHDVVYPMVPTGADLHQMIERPLKESNGELTQEKKESIK
jgi:acetolactate synthase-1/2/3 large subunit